MDSWTTDEIDKLIDIVRCNSVLYNQSLPGYSNRNTIDLTWRSVSLKFNNKSDKDCSKKWQLLRAGFRKRRHEYLPSGAGSVSKKKKWAYFDALSFLDVHMTERHTETNAPQSQNENSSEDALFRELDMETMPFEQCLTLNGSSQSLVELLTVRESEIFDLKENEEVNCPSVRASVTPTCSGRKRKNNPKTPDGAVNEAFTQYLQARIEKAPRHREKPAIALFFESIVDEVTQLEKSDEMELRLMILNFIKEKMPK